MYSSDRLGFMTGSKDKYVIKLTVELYSRLENELWIGAWVLCQKYR